MSLFNNNYKRSENLLESSDSVLFLIDIQEKLLKAVSDSHRVIKNSGVLLKAGVRLRVPLVVTEQYPKALGPTHPDLANIYAEGESLTAEKLCFSATACQGAFEELKKLNKRQIIIFGIETHVCVQQTVLDLLANFDGWVCVVADAVSSREPGNSKIALERMAAGGAHIVTTEMVLFEWLRQAGTPEFKELQKLIL